ncbi:MAG: hypothetical protein FJ125_10520, partial [Deltaproteobacteria bacterium]|nr:hypothetical protein [Deltaproteobacteria bacterium]
MSGAPQSRGAGAGTGTPERSRTLAVLRFAVVLTAVLFFTVPLTSAGGVLGAVAGTTGGTLLGLRLARGRLRLAAVALAGLALALGGTLAAALATGSTLLPALVGPTGALQLAELLRWFLLTMAVVGALRFASARHPGLALLEVILAISCLALALSAHRDGAFHRPLELGDWAWSRGIDPARLLLALGALAGLGLTPLLLGEALGRHGRNLLSLVLLALGLLLLASRMPLPASRRPDAAGLRGEGEDGDRQRRPREGGRGSGQGDEGRGLTGPTPARPGDGGDAAGDLPREGAGSAGRGGDGGQPSAPPPSVADQFPFQDEVSNDGSESAVAVVVFHDDHHPANGFYYFRQVAFSQYNGRRMVRTTRDDADGDLFDGFPVLRKELELPESATWHDRVRTTVALLADHRQPFGLVAPRSLEGLPNPQAGRFVRTYRVVSVVIRSSYQEMLLAPAGEDGWSSALLSHYTALPADPRYRALAEEVTALLSAEFADLPLPRALAIKRWLDQHVTYSHRSKHAGADDPVASFLFGDRTGYCIHIAHAAVYLLRSLGVPALVGAG